MVNCPTAIGIPLVNLNICVNRARRPADGWRLHAVVMRHLRQINDRTQACAIEAILEAVDKHRKSQLTRAMAGSYPLDL